MILMRNDYNKEATEKLFELDFAKATYEDIIRLVRQGADVNAKRSDSEKNETLLDNLILAGNLPLAQFLIQNKTRLNTIKETSLEDRVFLIENGFEKVENPLMEYTKSAQLVYYENHENRRTCSPNDKNVLAFKKIYFPLLEKYQADLNTQDEDGRTPLMVLASNRAPAGLAFDILNHVIKKYQYDYTLHDKYGENLYSYLQYAKHQYLRYYGIDPIINAVAQKTLMAYKAKKEQTQKVTHSRAVIPVQNTQKIR